MKLSGILSIAGAALFLTLQPLAAKTRVACLGNSITQLGYPAVLESILGDEYQVRNFGVSAMCAQVSVDSSYVKTDTYGFAKDYGADIAVFMFGANDSKPWHWSNKQAFAQQYTYMIGQVAATVEGKVFICLPLPAFENTHAIQDSILEHEITPAIIEMVTMGSLADDCSGKYVLVDARAPFEGKPELFQDGVHPNEQGKQLLAQTIADAIKESSSIRKVHLRSQGTNNALGRPSVVIPVDRIPVPGLTRDMRGRTVKNPTDAVPVPVITNDEKR